MGRQRGEPRRAKSHLRIVRVDSKVILGPFRSSVLGTSVYSFTPPQTPGRSVFFHPLQLHLEPADLLEQLGLRGVGGRRGRRPAREDTRRPGEELLLPVVDEGGVDA